MRWKNFANPDYVFPEEVEEIIDRKIEEVQSFVESKGYKFLSAEPRPNKRFDENHIIAVIGFAVEDANMPEVEVTIVLDREFYLDKEIRFKSWKCSNTLTLDKTVKGIEKLKKDIEEIRNKFK